MSNKIKIPIEQELCNYINRIIFEKDNLCFIINRFFEKHANDDNDDILRDDSFLQYHKEFELLLYEYNMVVAHITTIVYDYLTKLNIENVKAYEWSIDDFVSDRFIVVKKM